MLFNSLYFLNIPFKPQIRDQNEGNFSLYIVNKSVKNEKRVFRHTLNKRYETGKHVFLYILNKDNTESHFPFMC